MRFLRRLRERRANSREGRLAAYGRALSAGECTCPGWGMGPGYQIDPYCPQAPQHDLDYSGGLWARERPMATRYTLEQRRAFVLRAFESGAARPPQGWPA